MNPYSIAQVTMRMAESVGSSGAPDIVARSVWAMHDGIAGTSSAAAGVAGTVRDFQAENAALVGTAGSIAQVAGATYHAYGAYAAAVERGVNVSAQRADAAGVAGMRLATSFGVVDPVVGAALSVAQRAAPEHREQIRVLQDALPSHTATAILTAGIDRVDAVIRGDSAALAQSTRQLLGGEYGEIMRGAAIGAVALSGPEARLRLGELAESGRLGYLAHVGSVIGAKVFELVHGPVHSTAERGVHLDPDGPAERAQSATDQRADRTPADANTSLPDGSAVRSGPEPSATGTGPFATGQAADGDKTAGHAAEQKETGPVELPHADSALPAGGTDSGGVPAATRTDTTGTDTGADPHGHLAAGEVGETAPTPATLETGHGDTPGLETDTPFGGGSEPPVGDHFGDDAGATGYDGPDGTADDGFGGGAPPPGADPPPPGGAIAVTTWHDDWDGEAV